VCGFVVLREVVDCCIPDRYRRGGGQFFSWDVFSKLRAECVRFAAPRKTLGLAILQDPKYKEWYKQKFEEMKEKDAVSYFELSLLQAFIEVCTPRRAGTRAMLFV
jgi:hypothetical protein